MLKIKIYGARINRTKDGEKLTREALRMAVGEYFPDIHTAVDVRMVSGEEMREINCDTRGVDKVTDVLSFPMLDMKNGKYDGDITKEADPESGDVFLGDVIICYDMVREQALDFGNLESRECAYLAVHSALHLLGFDHIDEAKEKKIMRIAEEKILKKMGITKDGN